MRGRVRAWTTLAGDPRPSPQPSPRAELLNDRAVKSGAGRGSLSVVAGFDRGASTMTAPPALAVEHVTHAYGARVALDDVSFSVAPGSFCVLLGLNGAGKSTLFSVITHLYAPRAGVVRIFGHDVARESGAALARLGVVFQQRTLDPDLSVEQNLAYHGALQGMTRARAARAAEDPARARRIRRPRRATRPAISPADRCGASRSRARCCTAETRVARRADRRPRHQGARGHSRDRAANSRATTASACCGRRISSTRSGRRIMSSCCTRARCARTRPAARSSPTAGAAGIGEAFAKLTGARRQAEEVEP